MTRSNEFSVGMVERFGSHRVTREEVIEFASRYDPSSHHTNDEAAAANPIFGKLCASGAHTIAMTTRMLVDYWRERGHTGMGSRGFAVQFLRPVFPGDLLSCQFEATDLKKSQSRPTMATMYFRISVFNQAGENVMLLDGSSFHELKQANPA